MPRTNSKDFKFYQYITILISNFLRSVLYFTPFIFISFHTFESYYTIMDPLLASYSSEFILITYWTFCYLDNMSMQVNDNKQRLAVSSHSGHLHVVSRAFLPIFEDICTFIFYVTNWMFML